MVRLKGMVEKASFNSFLDFNSTMVRLKASSSVKLFGINANFNSTMVRLKVIDATTLRMSSLFQFHYGSIKG